MSMEQLLLSHGNYNSLMLRIVLEGVFVQLFVFQWSQALIMTSRYIFFFSKTWDVEGCFLCILFRKRKILPEIRSENIFFGFVMYLDVTSKYILFFSETWDVEDCSGFLVRLFVFQWSWARDHVEGIEFNWEIVPFDRGFVHHNQTNTLYRIWKIHVNESDKYVLQNIQDHVEGIEFNWEIVPFDRGFCTSQPDKYMLQNQIITCYRIWKNTCYRVIQIHVTESDKYMLQNIRDHVERKE